MSRHGSVLPIPDDPRINALIEAWPLGFDGERWPRSAWLHDVELILELIYPQSSSRDRNLTARSLAPFPLKERDW